MNDLNDPVIIQKVDDIIDLGCDGPSEKMRSIMDTMPMSESIVVLLAPLSATFWYKDEVPYRAAYAAKVRAEITERQLDRVEDLMRGLELL